MPPLTADLTFHLLYSSFCVPTSPPTPHSVPLHLPSPSSHSSPVCHTIGGGWHPQGHFLCACRRARRQTCVCVCFDVFSDPATLSTCDILPPQSIPRGHVHTERYGHTHHLHLPMTFWVLLVEFLISFFCALFGITKPGYIYFLLAHFFRGQRLLLQPSFKKHCVCSLTFGLNFCLSVDESWMKCCDCCIDYLLIIWHFLSLFVFFPSLPALWWDSCWIFFGEWNLWSLMKQKKTSLCWKPKWPSLSVSQPPQLPCGEPLLLVLSVISSLQRSQ